MGLHKCNPTIAFSQQLDIQNHISHSHVFHLKAMGQKALDFLDHIEVSPKDQYVIDIQAQDHSFSPNKAVVYTLVGFVHNKAYRCESSVELLMPLLRGLFEAIQRF